MKNRHFTAMLMMILAISGCGDEESKPQETWEHAVDGSYTADISENGQFSVVSSIHHGLGYWDIKNNKLLYQWSHGDPEENLVLAAHIAPDNSHVVTADRLNFTLWNTGTGQAVGFWKVRESNIRDVAVSSGGRQILIGKSNGVVVHVDVVSGRRIEFVGHTEKINSVDLSPNGNFALSGGNDYVAYLWDTRSGQVIYRFNLPSRVTKVALHDKGGYAFTADSKKHAQIWDLKTGESVSRLKYLHRQEVFSAVRFSEDGKRLLTGAPTRKLTLWNTQNGDAIAEWRVTPRKNSRPKGAVVHAVAFLDDGSFISESSSGLAEKWTLN